MDTLEKFSGPLDGRDEEEMDKLIADLESAVDGLNITLRVVPFDLPTIVVYGPYGQDGGDVIGTMMWSTDSLGDEVTYEWWTISTRAVTAQHGSKARKALAFLINEYIDRKVGLG